MISRLDLVIDFLKIFEICLFSGRLFGGCFGANAHEKGGGKKTRKRARKGERNKNDENHLGLAFPLKEENLQPPSSSGACKSALNQTRTVCLKARWRIYIYILGVANG